MLTLSPGDRVYLPNNTESTVKSANNAIAILSTGESVPAWQLRLIPQPGDRAILINGLYRQWVQQHYNEAFSALREMQQNQAWGKRYNEIKDDCNHLEPLLVYLNSGERRVLERSTNEYRDTTHEVSWCDAVFTIKLVQQEMAIVFAGGKRRSVPINCLGVIERVRANQVIAA
jgi:hypothetical protein